ncbi:hypothetical protein CAEBREN_07053 [Caenorhabditis brenneri]|uniref:Uncharacterized protein n=1 Tax=Caenorhabditis brenneri TaxID=135651 RepID=G0MD54_CAEBE|nr:hypothetical protein CAEBREN_07053 [Caenorhabditis brenneri]
MIFLAVIGVALLQVALPAPITSQAECVITVNLFRSNYAKQHQIANMNELVYNKGMEILILKNLDIDALMKCDTPSHTVFEKIEMFSDMNENFKGFEDKISAPNRTDLACFKRRCEENGQDVYGLAFYRSTTPSITGPPGTKCPEDRPFSRRGLYSL